MNKFEELKATFEKASDDAAKFYNNANAAAGVRLRAFMQTIKNQAQEVRTDVTDLKNKEK